MFDYKKLDWFNGQYIRQMGDEALTDMLLPYLVDAGFLTLPLSDEAKQKMASLTPVVKERMKVLADVVELSRFLFEEPTYEDVTLFAAKGVELPVAYDALQRAYEVLKKGFADKKETQLIEEELTELAQQLGVKVNAVFMPIRVALTGSTVSLPLFDSIGLLGQDKTGARIENALAILKRGVV